MLIVYKSINSKQRTEVKRYPFCLGNISKDLKVNNMKKTGLNGMVYDFSVIYETIDISNIINIHKYLMKKQYCIKALINYAKVYFLDRCNGSCNTVEDPFDRNPVPSKNFESVQYDKKNK